MFTLNQLASRIVSVIALTAAVAAGVSTMEAVSQLPVATADPSRHNQGMNGQIAFGRFDPDLGDFSLWTARSDGTHQRRLTTDPSFMSDWAPDGTRLIFDYVHGADVHIASIGRYGSHRTQLTFGPGIQEVPRYSPDGRHIVFDASVLSPDDPVFATDIWMMDSDGSNPRQVTHGGFDVEPAFSPDGQYITFGRIVGPTSPSDFLQREAVYVVRRDGTGLRQVVAPRPGLEHPRWSPDGRLITFNIGPESAGAPGAGSIYSVHVDGSGLRVIRAANREWTFTKAVWSPDGRRMLVVCHRVVEDIDYLCQMNPRTGHLQVVVTTPPGRPVNFPSWGPTPR